jgi:hypothetical protein
MAATIINATTSEVTITAGDEANLKIRLSGSDAFGITSDTITLNAAFFENSTTVESNHTIPSNLNAMSAGPIKIDEGVTVTIEEGAEWTIV